MPWRAASTSQQEDYETTPHVLESTLQPLAHDDIKTLMQTAKNIRHLGIETSDLPIPKICVVGDQSTGKSSVIESISEIRTPRSSGTCTRCPIEINLSNDTRSSIWRCDVYLVIKYTYATKIKKSDSRGNPLAPWIESDAETLHFASLADKEDVREVLKRAQLAILNPSRSPDLFKPGSRHVVSDGFQVPFSPNVVRVDIFGPSLLNLSFYDLPGVISQDKDESVPRLIVNLVKEYIKPANCIILQTLTMNHDAANSNAASIIKTSRAISRTVGVLTKPDLFISDSLHEWEEILDGKKFALDLGYYVVKNNPDPEVTHCAARIEEEQFFARQEPFNTHLSMHRDKFGTRKLQEALSGMLAAEIKKSLPEIISKIGAKLADIRKQLASLPQPLEGNVSLRVSHRILEFGSNISKELDGGSLDCTFFESWHAAAKLFHNYVVCSYPLLTFPRPQLQRGNGSQQSQENPRTPTPRRVEPIMLSSDDEGSPSPSKRSRLMTQSAKRRAGDSIALTPAKPTLADRLGKLEGAAVARGESKRFSTDDITSHLNKLNTGLPSARNQKIVERMHREGIQHWAAFIGDFLKQTRELCKELLKKAVDETFSEWSTTALYSRIEDIIRQFQETAIDDQVRRVEDMYRREMSKAMTFDNDDLDRYESEIRSGLLVQSQKFRYRMYIQQEQIAEEKLAKHDVARIEQTIAEERDPFAPQIQEMATVRAYYHCSARRFADYVALDICTNLFTKLKSDMPEELAERIGLNKADANETCQILLAIPPEVADRRERLEREQKMLMEGHRQLKELARMPVGHDLSFSTFDPAEA